MNPELNSVVEKDRFAKFIGIRLVEVGEGYAVAKMEVDENHLNGVGLVQGGAIFTLADFTFAAASNSTGLATLGVSANINYFKPPKGKVITAEAREVSVGRKLGHYSVDIFDESHRLCARLTAIGYIKTDC